MFSVIFDNLINRRARIAIIGLGYVGLPLASAFAEVMDVIGFDCDSSKIALYKTDNKSKVMYTDEPEWLREADFYIVAVPTPVLRDMTPDLSYLITASGEIGLHMKKGAVIVYESTVFPGATETVCVPIIEQKSGMKCGIDFKVGYSPERINPGDMEHGTCDVVKIVSGIDDESLALIKNVYSLIIKAGVYPVSSIKIAEAIKVAENVQRDVNIAFMNELAMALIKMEIDVNEVLIGMRTKWDALKFKPGLVGGHCIGIDPYYLIFQTQKFGFDSKLFRIAREVNERLSYFISDAIIQQFDKWVMDYKLVKVLILGVTYKEDCADIRNSKVFDMYYNLTRYGIETHICDGLADVTEVHSKHGIRLIDNEKAVDFNCIILAVAHQEFRNIEISKLVAMFGVVPTDRRLIVDVPGVLDKEKLEAFGIKCIQF